MGARVDIDLVALRRHLESPQGQAEMDRVVEIVKHNAVDETPPRTSSRKVTTKTGASVHPGSMKNGFKWRRTSKTVRRLYHKSSLFLLVEYGGPHSPTYAPMRRGARAAGLRFKEDPKP